MNIAVIAANGRTGQAFVRAALTAGHIVRAGVHSHADFSSHPNLTIVQCDATNEADVRQIIARQDAVVSFIGHVKQSPLSVQTDAMKVLARVLEDEPLKRIVSLTGTGVRVPGDKVSLVDWILNTGIGVIDPQRIRDGIQHYKFLKDSDLDWTVLRVLKLQNTRPRPFSLLLHGPTKWFVSRDEVAMAALQVIEENSFIREAPILGRHQR